MTNKDTRFQKGKSGNLKGRPRGSRNRSTVAAEMLLENQAAAITQKCVDMAMGGDPTALRLSLSRILPVKRDRNISIDLSDLKGAKDALGAVCFQNKFSPNSPNHSLYASLPFFVRPG